MIQFVDRMLGGGKKKMMKKVEQGDQGATDKSSTEEVRCLRCSIDVPGRE